jgi:hypothetical protein
MLRESIKTFFSTARSLFADKSSLAILAGMYALLLATLYGFIAIREATVVQVLLTLLFIALAPLLFFLLQSAIITHAKTGRIDWAAVLRASTKLALVTIPVILVGIGVMWLLNKWQVRYQAPFFSAPPPGRPPVPGIPTPRAVPPVYWPAVLFAWSRFLIFAVLLPLALIQFWISAAGRDLRALFRGGLRASLTRFGQTLAPAFAPGSLIIYVLGLLLFAVIPYALLFARIPTKSAWADIAIFSLRLVLVFAFILFGWLITLRAFTKSAGDTEEVTAPPVALEPTPTPATAVDQPEMSAV